MNLSVALAVKNEEENIARCLDSVKNLADEIVVVDEYSTDNTVKVLKKYKKVKIIKNRHENNFHESKMKAINNCHGEWVLQLDADEVVSKELASEILSVSKMSNKALAKRQISNKRINLFLKHQKAVENRDGKIGNSSENIVAFFIPRKNMFIGKPLIHAGVYPDGVIRFFKKGKAYLPAKNVHEQFVVDGKVSWLENDLLHYDSPTLKRYLDRANRYTTLLAKDYKAKHLSKNFYMIFYFFGFKFTFEFLKRYIRHSGYKDGVRGFLWCFYSAWQFPMAYSKYFVMK